MSDTEPEYVVHLHDGDVHLRTDAAEEVHPSVTTTVVPADDITVEGGHLFLWRGNERVAAYAPDRWLYVEMRDEPEPTPVPA